MPRFILICFTILGFVACTAPQGQKLTADAARAATTAPAGTATTASAVRPGLDPVALGPTSSSATLGPQNEGEMVRLTPNGTLTVTLPAAYRQGYNWRLAEIPDPSVLKLVSKEFTSGDSLSKPGEQVMVFQATGLGDVQVKLRYGSLWASSEMGAVKPYEFVASVAPEEAKPAKTTKKKKALKKA